VSTTQDPNRTPGSIQNHATRLSRISTNWHYLNPRCPYLGFPGPAAIPAHSSRHRNHHIGCFLLHRSPGPRRLRRCAGADGIRQRGLTPPTPTMHPSLLRSLFTHATARRDPDQPIEAAPEAAVPVVKDESSSHTPPPLRLCLLRRRGSQSGCRDVGGRQLCIQED
jgi:hypothetical protein